MRGARRERDAPPRDERGGDALERPVGDVCRGGGSGLARSSRRRASRPARDANRPEATSERAGGRLEALARGVRVDAADAAPPGAVPHAHLDGEAPAAPLRRRRRRSLVGIAIANPGQNPRGDHPRRRCPRCAPPDAPRRVHPPPGRPLHPQRLDGDAHRGTSRLSPGRLASRQRRRQLCV